MRVRNPTLNGRELAETNTRSLAPAVTESYISFRPSVSNTISVPTGKIIMYKTVRKGDASLQYTILPQTDQFTSGGFPQTSGKTQLRVTKYAIGALMVLITMSCVATPFLMHQNDHNLFADTTLAMSRAVDEPVRNASRSVQTKEPAASSKNRGRIPITTTVSTTEVTKRKDLDDTTTSFGGILRGEEEEEAVMVVLDDATLAGMSFRSNLATGNDATRTEKYHSAAKRKAAYLPSFK